MMRQRHQGCPFLYDETSSDIIGIKDPDGSELLIMHVPHIGYFYDTTDQAAAANTATAVTFNTPVLSKGVTLVDNTKITLSRKGTYNFQFSIVFANHEAADYDVSVWLRKNGTNMVDSNTDITVAAKHGATSGKAVAAWNLFDQSLPGDYYEVMWSTPINTIVIDYQAAQANPDRPATPSVIMTVNEVEGSHS